MTADDRGGQIHADAKGIRLHATDEGGRTRFAQVFEPELEYDPAVKAWFGKVVEVFIAPSRVNLRRGGALRPLSRSKSCGLSLTPVSPSSAALRRAPAERRNAERLRGLLAARPPILGVVWVECCQRSGILPAFPVLQTSQRC
jgi:hypothetical protein